jgi:predicted metal-dependent hydrolase
MIDVLSEEYQLPYSGLTIRKLSSRWGSCSSHQKISLSTYLIQLPDDLISYVITHELVHTKHMNHGKDFWNKMEQIIPNVKEKRKKLKTYRPALFPQL